MTRTSNPTSVGRRGLMKRFTLLDHMSLIPEVHPTEASRHWTTSSMSSARITRICTTPCGTAETSSIPSGMADRSNLYHLPHREEDPMSLDDLNNRKGGGGGAFPCVNREVNVIFRGHKSQENKSNRSSMTDRYWWQPLMPPPPIGGRNARSPLLGRSMAQL
jgi:hypothetical protein